MTKKNSDIRNEWFISKVAELNAQGIKQVDVAQKLSVKPQYLTPIIKGTRNVSENLIAKFCQVFAINQNDLLSKISEANKLMSEEEIAQQDKEVVAGKWIEGTAVPQYIFDSEAYQNLYKTHTATLNELDNIKNTVTAKSERKLIPFYDINAEAGTIQLSNMEVAEEPEEMIDAGDWFRDADCAMRVHGDSMSPVYKSGSIVVLREVHDKQLIMYGQDYVIITSEYRTIKRLQKSKKKSCWLACSTNEETWEKGELAGTLIHEPFDVPIDCVYKLFRVLGCVTRTESSRVVYAQKHNK